MRRHLLVCRRQQLFRMESWLLLCTACGRTEYEERGTKAAKVSRVSRVSKVSKVSSGNAHDQFDRTAFLMTRHRLIKSRSAHTCARISRKPMVKLRRVFLGMERAVAWRILRLRTAQRFAPWGTPA